MTAKVHIFLRITKFKLDLSRKVISYFSEHFPYLNTYPLKCITQKYEKSLFCGIVLILSILKNGHFLRKL